jgi:capsular polysaccharide biosynthesis protein
MPFQFASNQHGTCPATFVAEFNRGRFWGFYGGSVFTEGGQLVAELSKDVWGPTLHTAYTRAHLPTPKWLAGRALSLVTPEAANNYHHWTVDLLSRAGLAERAGYRLHDFDHVLIKDRGLPFQKEALKRLEIDEDKLIRVNDHTHLQVQTLVVPSVRMDNTRVNRGDLQFVRRLFLPQEPSPQSARRRLYVSRRDASFRRVVNEPEIMPLLQQHGFEEVSMSKMSVVEQAQLFAEAEVLVGPNGSALANVIFANPACRVIEFFAPGWVVPYNWMLCASLKLHYTAMIGDGPRPAAGTLPREIKQDIHLNVAAFKRILEKLPSRK